MNQPVPRRRPLERWRGGWPRDFWDPFGEFTQLWNRMSQLFESAEAAPEAWVPAVETEETDDAYLVRAELPGMKRENIDVELRGNELRITGEIKEEEGAKTLRRRYGKFAYHASLPSDADTDKVEADMSEGILTIRLPKAPQAVSRKIEIKS